MESPATDESTQESPAPSATCDSGLRPAYRVDAFAWPAECTKLGLQASGQLTRLIEGLIVACNQGHKVIAVAACRQGEGCTTLSLCAARRLAQGDRNVVVVDADFQNPQLARRLGLLPETGWEEVLSGRLPLSEAIIESAQQRLAVVPLLNPVSQEEGSTLTYSGLAASLSMLREHYDLVLVDLGEFCPGAVSEAAGHWIDAAVLIHDIRHTSHAELARARKRVEAAGVVEIGVVENFV
jgi:Mrp family chromosome partitioning ATPase